MESATSGANTVKNLSLAGKTVDEVRIALKDVLNPDDTATVLINGKKGGVADDYVIKEGDSIEFVKGSGKKGVH